MKKIILLLLIPIFLLFFGITLKEDNAGISSENEDISIEQKLGQSFVVGVFKYELTNNEKRILEKIKPAGVVFYRRNFKDEKQFIKLVADVRKVVGKDCFFMIDEEPNGAGRLEVFKGGFADNFPNWDVFNRGSNQLFSFGLNADLAPLADFPFNPNTFIRKRIPVKDIEDLKKFNESFISILHENKVMSTLKHFPGMGFFNDDPHLKVPGKEIGEEDFNKSLDIFKSGIDGGADFVMTAHGLYSNIDKENIATFSSLIVKDLLLGQLGFKGLVITDDLSDMPVKDLNNITHSEVAIKALKAGHNLVMFSHQLERTEIVFDRILEESKNDNELVKILEDDYNKIVEFKKSRAAFLY